MINEGEFDDMNTDSRTKNTVMNAFFGIGMQLLVVLCQFVGQTVFIKILSAEYLGLNGVFSNVLQFLSLAELGIGGAITFSLYQPLAEKDENMIRAIMRLYKTIYTVIGAIILVGGIVTSYFLDYFITAPTSLGNIQILFILFLMNSVVSYFFAYRRTLLIADQRGYVDSLNQGLFKILQVVLQSVFLIMTKQYAVFLVIQIFTTILSNYRVYSQTNKLYGFLKNKNEYQKIPRDVVSKLKKNAVGAFSSKIGTIIMFGTSNILISKFIGLAAVGVYSNYMLLLNSVSGLLNRALNSVSATIANYIHSREPKKTNEKFFDYMYVVNFFSLMFGFVLAVVLNPFINLWLGENFKLSEFTVALLIFNWVLNLMRNTVLSFMTAYGTYWETRWKSVAEALTNLVVGVILISTTTMVVNAVIVASIIVGIGINAWSEPYILLKKNISFNKRKYVMRYGFYVSIAIDISLLTIYSPVHVKSNLLIIVFASVVSVLIFTILFMLVTMQFEENKRFRKMFMGKIARTVSVRCAKKLDLQDSRVDDE